jgi:hypothetical protein
MMNEPKRRCKIRHIAEVSLWSDDVYPVTYYCDSVKYRWTNIDLAQITKLRFVSGPSYVYIFGADCSFAVGTK